MSPWVRRDMIGSIMRLGCGSQASFIKLFQWFRSGVLGTSPRDIRVGEERFIRRWGGLKPDLSTIRFQKEHHFCPVGAETGFRPDGRPIEVLESAGQNVLIVPPWDDRTAMLNLMASLQRTPRFGFLASCTSRRRAEICGRVETTLERYGARHSEQPTFPIIDAHLAPEREAGMYLGVQATFVDETWGNARQSIRRASDCGRRILRGA